MKRNLKIKLLLAAVLILLPQIVLGQTGEEKMLVEKTVNFYRAAAKGDWKTLYSLSVSGKAREFPIGKDWIKYWTKENLIEYDIPGGSNIYIGLSEASLRITFYYQSNVFTNENSLLPKSYDFSFQKIKNEWKIKSFRPTADLFIDHFIKASDLIEEKAFIERERDYLSTWESLIILDYADLDWTKDIGTIPKFQRLFEAIIDKSNNSYVKAEAYWHLGENFMSTRNFKNAKDSFNKGLELGKESDYEYAQFLNLTGLSEVSVYENDSQKAIQLFNTAFSFYSDRSDAYNSAVWSSNRVGNAFFNTKNYKAATKIYQLGIKVAEDFKDEYWQFTLLNGIGDGYFQLKNYKEAQVWYKKTLDFIFAPGTDQIYQGNLPEIYKIIGKTYQKSKEFDLAIRSYKKAINSALIKKEPQELVDVYDTLAKFYASQEDLPNTIKTYNTLWTKLLELKATSDLAEAIRNGVSVVTYDLGRIREAEDLLNKWLQKGAILLKGKDLTSLLSAKARIQTNQSRYQEAHLTFRQILLVQDGLLDDKLFAYIGIAQIYALQGQYEKGFLEFEEFEQMSLTSQDKDLVKYIALIAKNRNNPTEASRLFQKIITENQDDKRILAIAYLIQGGMQFYRIGDYAKFVNIEKHEAEIKNAFVSIDKSLTYLDDLDEISQLIATLALYVKSSIYYSMRDFDNSSVNIEKGLNLIAKNSNLLPLFSLLKPFEGHIFVESNQWQKARQSLSEAISVIERDSRVVTGGINGKILISARNQAYYKEMVRTLLALNDIDEALIYSERTKGGIVLELNKIRRNNKLDQLPQKVSKESPKNTNVSATGKNLVPSWKKFKDFIPGAQIITVTGDDSESTDTDENNYNIPVLNIEQTKELLPNRDTALLEFFVDEEDIYLFVLADESQKNATNMEWRKDLKWQVFVIKNRYELRKQINTLQRRIKERKMIYNKYCRSVYNLLIKPVEQHLKDKPNWIIIPDDFIWKVPFQALQSQPDRFLIYDHNVSFATSLNVLAQMREIKKIRTKKSAERTSKDILAIGIKTFNKQFSLELAPMTQVNRRYGISKVITEKQNNSERSDSQIRLVSLPYAEDEVRGISDIYGSNRVDLRIDPAETKAEFMKEAGKYRIVHVATHGIINNDDPMKTSLVFGNPLKNLKASQRQQTNTTPRNKSLIQRNLGDNQLLTTNEILEMQMNTDLIVLSACDTGSGTSASGEGLIGLSWAFSAAGVPTIVSSQWTVNDAATAILMREFYQNLKQNEVGNIKTGDISQALRKSTLSFMEKDKKYLHPYYWASFITIGEP